MSDKLAGSKWRSAENLLKLIKSVEKQKGYSLASSSGGYNRHKALEIAAKHMGLDKTIGQGYTDFADKLKWGPIPEKLKQNILASHFNHETPKYIFRGITPGKNIADPFKFDNAGLSANFLHGSPSFGSAAHYSKPFGPGRGNEVYQVFKPTKDQAYMPDFTAVNFVDKATGKLTGGAERLTWDKQIPFLKQHVNAIEKEHPGRFDAPTKAYTAFKDLVYETPVFPKNKALGTFLARLKPSDSSSDFSILGQTKTLLDRAEVARIPNSLKNKAIQMALESQKQIHPVKVAGSRWRTATNLVKIMERIEEESRKIKGQSYDRLQALQEASKRFGLNKQIGEAYKQESDKLNWKPLPKAVQKTIMDTNLNLKEPRYIYRGITPGKNILNPHTVDNTGETISDFVHGTISPNNASEYAKSFGPTSKGGRMYQLFKSRLGKQDFFPDYSAYSMQKTPPGTHNWENKLPIFEKNRILENKFRAEYSSEPYDKFFLNNHLVTTHAYETPVTNANKSLGTFLVKAPYGTSFVQDTANRTARHLEGTTYARIPANLKNKFTNMGIEQNRKINTRNTDRTGQRVGPILIADPIKQASERVRVVMPYKGQYLMETLSNPKWPENLGKRRFVGGGVDEGETPEQAAARELFEELGIKINPKRFKHLGLDTTEKNPMHYLQLQRHGLKPGEYKSTVGSDPIIYLNKGMPAGSDYLGADLASLLKRSDWQVPSKQQLDSLSTTPKSPAPIKPLPTKTPAMPSNKFLGTFLARIKPETHALSTGSQSIFDQNKSLLNRTQIASIPRHLNNKFVQMSLEAQKKLN